MKPLETIGRTTAEDGTELVLYRRDDAFQIRVNGLELMTSRVHGSEEALAKLACAELAAEPRPRLLVGGLGMGFTLRAALDQLPPDAVVEVAEVFSAVVEWCRGPLAHLAGNPLADPRVQVRIGDVGMMLRSARSCYRAVLLDVDNGPEALTLAANARLYGSAGIACLVRALAPGGVVGVWSAADDRGFSRRLRRAGLEVSCHQVRARLDRGPKHTIFLGRTLRSVAGSQRSRRR